MPIPLKIVEMPVIAKLRAKYEQTPESQPKVMESKVQSIVSDISDLKSIEMVLSSNYTSRGAKLVVLGVDGNKYHITIEKQ